MAKEWCGQEDWSGIGAGPAAASGVERKSGTAVRGVERNESGTGMTQNGLDKYHQNWSADSRNGIRICSRNRKGSEEWPGSGTDFRQGKGTNWNLHQRQDTGDQEQSRNS